MGYHHAGFDEIVGVDNRPMKRFPFAFVESDALDFLRGLAAGASVCGYYLSDFDAIHASPPCQRYSLSTKSIPGLSETHPDLLPPVRDLLIATGKPYVIENVVGAPMRTPLLLCGSMFELLVRRHRLFESSFLLLSKGECRHAAFKGNYPCGRSNGTRRAGERSKVVHVYGQGCSRGDRKLWQQAMGIDWMTMNEMAQAIPPAYTEWIGRQLLACLANE
jgi:DNA (cytosine-5)-methyltransferase 1